MLAPSLIRRLLLGLSTGLALAVAGVSVPVFIGTLTPAYAQVSAEFEDALAPYGEWRRDPRFGDVWVPTGLSPDWRPYENGHWVYTDEWGWYWVSDDQEEDWGWVTYHYGRWAFDRDLGWFWVPGDEWAPAWVDWRYGEDYVGWAPLPPDDLIDTYEVEPAYWVFVPGRYMTAPRLRSYYVPRERRVFILRNTRIINRTLAVRGARLAVNPGISPAFVAAATRTALPTYRVRPRVLGSTQGVSGAVRVRPEDLRARRQGGPAGTPRVNAVSVQRTTTVINPGAAVPAPKELGKGERGQLGSHPPRAAQGGAAAPQQQPQTTPAKPPAGAPLRTGPAPVTTPTTPQPLAPGAAPSGQQPPGPPKTPERREIRPPTGSPAGAGGGGGAAPTIRQGEPQPQSRAAGKARASDRAANAATAASATVVAAAAVGGTRPSAASAAAAASGTRPGAASATAASGTRPRAPAAAAEAAAATAEAGREQAGRTEIAGGNRQTNETGGPRAARCMFAD